MARELPALAWRKEDVGPHLPFYLTGDPNLWDGVVYTQGRAPFSYSPLGIPLHPPKGLPHEHREDPYSCRVDNHGNHHDGVYSEGKGTSEFHVTECSCAVAMTA